MAYKYFGDVVTFDLTYLTNKYKMSFVPFNEVNHHQESIMVGYSLLCDEIREFCSVDVYLVRSDG